MRGGEKMTKAKSTNVQAIIQALNAAETNIKLAKSLLSGVSAASPSKAKKSPRDIPGISGVFDGESMVAEDGKKYPVNPNYAAKSRLVVGDSLKMIKEDGKNFFKQVEKVEREKLEGVLSKKGDQYVAVTDEGEYRLLPEAVEFYESAAEGDRVEVLVPKANKKAPFAALDALVVLEKEKEEEEEKKEEAKKAPVAKAEPESEPKPEPEAKEKPKPRPKPKPKPKPKAKPKDVPKVTKEAEEAEGLVEDDDELR
jgi:hypothetical protein